MTIVLMLALLGADGDQPPPGPFVTIRALPQPRHPRVISGVLVAEGLVLTASRALGGATRLEIAGHPCTVVRTDFRSDLALLRVDLPGRRVARLAARPAALGARVHLPGGRDIGAVHLNRDVTAEFWDQVHSFEITPQGVAPPPWGTAILNDRDEVVGLVTRMSSLNLYRPAQDHTRVVCATALRGFLEKRDDHASR